MSIYEGAQELYDSLTSEEQALAHGAKCPEHPLNVWTQSYGEDQTAWCEAGLSGAHLTHYIVAGCSFHGSPVRLRQTGRFCPGDCEWSKAESGDLPGGDYIRTDCGCGYEVIYTPEGWQHDAAEWLWGGDHSPDIDAEDEAKAEAWQQAYDRMHGIEP